MTSEVRIPEFAVLGHPNEGKSAVVSTLTEDDQIRVSPMPGETTTSCAYTVKIDGKEIIRFVDTPGFQVPQQTLAWFQAYAGPADQIVDQFIRSFEKDPFYADECELFRPVAKGAGIIYVVDGSRPVREDDLAEIEILRLTGRPRMAVINSKTDQKDYSQDWKEEFRKSFNAIRFFNANTADFNERIAMIESLKPIDQEWENTLSNVIQVFRSDWQARKHSVCIDMVHSFEKCLSYTLSEGLLPGEDVRTLQKKLNEKYELQIKKYESRMFCKIRTLFKHNIFDIALPEHSVLSYDLFSKQNWELLGLTMRQLASAGAVVGGSVGAVLDTAAAGITFGVFTAIGGVLGAGSALWGGKKITREKRGGFRLGGDRLVVGPVKDLQFLYVILDRALIYAAHMAGRAHGRRNFHSADPVQDSGKKGYSTHFNTDQKKICTSFFKAVTRQPMRRDDQARIDFQGLVTQVLDQITLKNS